ncbi:TPA: hypothetical protein P2K63_000107 [Aeromonas salmonicida]|uniref:Uncharacterized protein n=2 Tax=Aeromonas TaxID=642 RepID=A0A7D5UKK2_AERCA|nr:MULTISPECIES: hypothetical protein [Aeromonas]HDN9374623.1 hypothetical protein [Aeromonas salmonicida]QLI60267.1 hypothetical protein C1C91_22760 [Aeromonas caviae]HDN9378932.1 hypothetical protein [Aeromonas salmonicida]HDN9389826.1 hypothetical protein [Aeromonas salmonicida]HDN9411736.1 hypothetical protein [Aeromonas salmonicida]
MAIGSINLGMKWHSVGSVRHNVEVVLPNDRTFAGDLSVDWNGTYNLTGAGGKTIKFKNFKEISIPNGQAASSFPYRMVVPFILYFLGSLIACHFFGLINMRLRDKTSR